LIVTSPGKVEEVQALRTTPQLVAFFNSRHC